MASLLPVTDWNLNITPTSSTAAAIATGTATAASLPTIIPKKEPKLEPLDDFDDNNFQTPVPIFYGYPDKQQPNFSSNFNPTQYHATAFSPSTPTPTHTPTFNSGNLPSSSSTESSNVLSDFLRISQLFNTAFAQGAQNYISEDYTSLEDPNNSKAIVPVNADNNNASHLSNVVVSRKYTQRSRELVRVTDLSSEDMLYFRDVVRRTRMVYDSLRVFAIVEDEKVRILIDASQRRARARADLKAAALMRARGLWLNRDKRIVGAIPGVEIGDVYFFRMELCVVGLHGQPQGGIDYLPGSQSSNGEPIATSVIVSGGYEDDEDTGEVIIYTGQGGQDKNGRQCMNQKLECGNLALERSLYYGIEVRVVRGFKYEGSVSGKVYVYDGLYRIVQSWFDVGRSGFGVYKFRLVRIENQPEMGTSILKTAMHLRTRPPELKPRGYVSLDLSLKREKVPVFLFNDVDNNHDPAFYEYLVTSLFPPIVHQGRKGTGCECVGGCQDGCSCAMRNGGEFAYDQNGILIRGKPVVIECGPHCHCPPTCRNRVSQRGVRNRLEVFRSRETGWGVRSLDLIQAGAFICEFSGVVLTHQQAEIFTMNGDSLVYPSRFAERWTEWGDLSDIFPEFARPSFPSIPPMDFAMDVSRLRNVACYVSHSSSPNILVQPVLYDHDNVSFPHIMLFAMENIPPLREISLDYGVDDEWTGKLSICN